MMRKAIANVTSIVSKRWYAVSKRPYIVQKVTTMKSLGLSQLVFHQ